MSSKAVIKTVDAPHTSGRRMRRAFMEAGVVLSLTLAIVAVLCMFGLQHVSAMEMDGMSSVDSGGRITMGAVLLAGFVGMCGLTTFMLRNTLQPTRPQNHRHSREG
ncbi:MAG TPA: hypothetical protein VIQ29_15880 [Ancylobacter sp.]